MENSNEKGFFLGSSNGKLVLTSEFCEMQRQCTLSPEEISYDKIRKALRDFYPELSDDFTLKYRDNEEELITIGSQEDLVETFRWVAQTNRKTPLHIFILSKENDKNVLHGITKMFMQMSIQQTEDPDSTILKGSEWKGECKYSASGESYPLVMNITSVTSDAKKKVQIEGTITWETLDCTTRFLGIYSPQTKSFRFSEYEILDGEDNVELPAKYSMTIEGNFIRGKTVGAKEEATLQLEFGGIDDKTEGFLELLHKSYKRIASKRKYNLVTNSNIERPTIEDQRAAFKKVTQGAVPWYDKSIVGELEPREKEPPSKKKYAESCKNCGLPKSEQMDSRDPNKTVVECPNYPNCHPEPPNYFVFYF
eukprot:TRINITY_DN2717_c0_g1_i1.p1 TRINITY_DN2717_c0_g1~~TRINITY_DN2717_c0_g1_i1.p1  ORF type:complete len:365 (-),score=95.82 TRINITY_DN2717_c0_g1_i1:61-1155(-)